MDPYSSLLFNNLNFDFLKVPPKRKHLRKIIMSLLSQLGLNVESIRISPGVIDVFLFDDDPRTKIDPTKINYVPQNVKPLKKGYDVPKQFIYSSPEDAHAGGCKKYAIKNVLN